MLPKIIVNSGFSYNHMSHGENLEVSKKISGHGIGWKLDVETHKVIRELKKVVIHGWKLVIYPMK